MPKDGALHHSEKEFSEDLRSVHHSDFEVELEEAL